VTTNINALKSYDTSSQSLPNWKKPRDIRLRNDIPNASKTDLDKTIVENKRFPSDTLIQLIDLYLDISFGI
jgi:hypothetical protein